MIHKALYNISIWSPNDAFSQSSGGKITLIASKCQTFENIYFMFLAPRCYTRNLKRYVCTWWSGLIIWSLCCSLITYFVPYWFGCLVVILPILRYAKLQLLLICLIYVNLSYPPFWINMLSWHAPVPVKTINQRFTEAPMFTEWRNSNDKTKTTQSWKALASPRFNLSESSIICWSAKMNYYSKLITDAGSDSYAPFRSIDILGSSSDILNLDCGVPQSFLLGPFLCTLPRLLKLSENMIWPSTYMLTDSIVLTIINTSSLISYFYKACYGPDTRLISQQD